MNKYIVICIKGTTTDTLEYNFKIIDKESLIGELKTIHKISVNAEHFVDIESYDNKGLYCYSNNIINSDEEYLFLIREFKSVEQYFCLSVSFSMAEVMSYNYCLSNSIEELNNKIANDESYVNDDGEEKLVLLRQIKDLV